MLKRYQTFISSTYLDLKQERQEAMKAVMQSGCFPAGMELFLSSNSSLLSVIESTIDDSDIYILIIGGKYGSIDPKTEISYTEMEYNIALKMDKHILRFIHEDMDKLPVTKRETDEKKYPLLKAFISRAKNDNGVWVPWKDKGNLQAVISASLAEAKAKLPKSAGWIQASQSNIDQLVGEATSSMRDAYQKLKSDLPSEGPSCDIPYENFADLEETIRIPYNMTFKDCPDVHPSALEITWSELHSLFLSSFKTGSSEYMFMRSIETYLKKSRLLPTQRDTTTIEIDIYQCERIIHHLEASGLIRPKQGFDQDSMEHYEAWHLTEAGKVALLNSSVFQTVIDE